MPGGKQPHAFRVLPQHSAAAFPFGKVQQCVKIFASEQNGTADRARRAIFRCAQPENVPFFFLRGRKRSAHPVYGAAPQQRLITRHEQTAAKRRLPAQQGGQPEPHGVAAVGQGVQLRNLATLGGSLYSRFGFSDVLTMFLALDASVELYKGGIVPLCEYAERKKDRDVLVRVIVPKKAGARFDYRSVRPTRTDLPTLTCASVREGDGCRFVIGSRPARAMIFTPEAGSAEQMAEQVQREAVLGSNMRGSAAYRRKLVGTLVRRAAEALENTAE